MALTKVTRSGITDNSVNAAKIEDGTIVDADITPGTITNAKLAGSIANAKLANSSITINGAATALGGSVSAGSIAWQSVITSNTTMVAGRGYFVNTTSGAISMTLPSGGTAGDTIAIKDYAGTFATNNLTILRNSHNIQGAANDSLITTARASVILVYIDATKGWLYTNESNVGAMFPAFITATGGTVTTSGDFKIHSFTGDSNFVVSQLGNTGIPATYRDKVDYLVVAGGASGGARNPGNSNGGGGGGGFRESCGSVGGCYTASPIKKACGAITITAQTYPITVGGGGAAVNQSPSHAQGNDGSNSVFSTITSAGGGGGGGGGNNVPITNGRPGGSGGGAGGGIPSGITGGTGNTPPVSPAQGTNGGVGGNTPNGNGPAGGGGGATEVGQAAVNCSTSGRGGAGATTSISASPLGYGGGGGGSKTSGTVGAGSPCGSGGAGAINPTGPGPAFNAAANRGGGGGGGYAGGCTAGTTGAGGKGIVIIRYKFQ